MSPMIAYLSLTVAAVAVIMSLLRPESIGIGRPVPRPLGRGGAEHLRPVRPDGPLGRTAGRATQRL